MNKFVLGKKLGMTQIFTEDGLAIPVTVVQADPCTVVRIKNVEKDGYNAVVVGYEDAKVKKSDKTEKDAKKSKKSRSGLNEPEKGLFKKMNVPFKKYLREFKVSNLVDYKVGQDIKVSDMFKDGDVIDVTGISKGKGFQGAIKRHGQSRGKETHGSHYHRGVGSMGACSSPSRVFKGKKLPGHMGVDKVTVQNLGVVKVDEERNLILIRGAIPGPRNGLLTIKNAVKKK